jgi:uncharacterized membrane protein YphA (DoxX/SURF4 family)
MTTATANRLSWKTIAIWIARILMAALFVFAAVMKLTSQPMMVEEFGLFAAYGIGQWFRLLTGALELIGAVVVLIPTVSGIGALLLLIIDIGAFFAQIIVIHQDFVHTIIIAAILAALVFVQRGQISSRIAR